MAPHDEFLELCAAATAGELSADERAKLELHLAGCSVCRQAMSDYELATRAGIAALAPNCEQENLSIDSSFSVEDAERAFFKRLDRDNQVTQPVNSEHSPSRKAGQRFTYRPSQIVWRAVWMPFAAAVLLAVALGIASYKAGLKRGTDVVRTQTAPAKERSTSLEEEASDAGYERVRLMAKLDESSRVIEDLKRRLSEQTKAVSSLESVDGTAPRSGSVGQLTEQGATDPAKRRDAELAAAQQRMAELQKALDAATTERGEAVRHADVLEARVSELSELVRDREQALDQKQAEISNGQELLEHDRDIRELMGARQLYMADVRDVSGAGTDKTYGRVFYTKGKSLIFYAFDLDAHPGVQNASSFQAWGRRGPDRQQALSLGIFYEDNVSKKRWVLKASDPKTLQDIDAVFVTVEPNGGSHHPSGKPLLFAYLRVGPNHP